MRLKDQIEVTAEDDSEVGGVQSSLSELELNSNENSARATSRDLRLDRLQFGFQYIEVSGSESRCFYLCTAEALRLTPSQVEKIIFTTLEGIHDAPLLVLYGLSYRTAPYIELEMNSDPSTVKRAKENYFNNPEVKRMTWGSQLEAYLVSHFYGGKVAFSLYNGLSTS